MDLTCPAAGGCAGNRTLQHPTREIHGTAGLQDFVILLKSPRNVLRIRSQAMNTVEIIGSTDSAPRILAALSVYAGNLRAISAVPDWCCTPLNGEADIRKRMAALFVAINVTSQHGLNDDCDTAKRALHVFSAALERLQSRQAAN